MRVLIMDTDKGTEGVGLGLALRAKEWGHNVQYWTLPRYDGEQFEVGMGLVNRPKEWQPLMDKADLVILSGNSRYRSELEPYIEQSYPIFGANQRSVELELDRALGQQVLEQAGVQILPYIAVDNIDDAIDYVVSNREPICIKPWGGEADKSMTCVAKTPEEAIFHLERWREKQLKGKLLLQKKADGMEVGIAGWFTPAAGWLRLKEESWEHKRFLNDDLGQNTGEQGTVIRHVQDSLLFDRVLRPLTDYLYSIGYVGDCAVNCIIDKDGIPWPLEFTCRLGWPDFNIRQEVIDHDPVKWIRAALDGRDEFNPRPDIALGIVIAHGDYPIFKDPHEVWTGFPLKGGKDPGTSLEEMWPHLLWQMIKLGQEPFIDSQGKLKHIRTLVTAGNYVVVANGSGKTVKEASEKAYNIADNIRWPSNVMYRTDIGDKLKKELPEIQLLGYAKGMEYE